MNYEEMESSQRQHHEVMRREQEKCDMYEFHALKVATELCGAPKLDGDHWCYLYGANLQEGIAGFGKTVILAAQNFMEELNKEAL